MSFKILFMGTPSFAVPILRTLHQSNHKILEVYTQPPKKKNRGQKISFSPVHEYSNEINIPVRYPLTLNSTEEFEHFKKVKPDISIVVAYGKIIPSKFLNLENTIFINVHASLLPKWRGAAPIQRAIMNCDNETGISIMRLVPKLDAGPVLIKSKIKLVIKDIDTKEAEKIISEFNKPNLNDEKISKAKSHSKQKPKTKKISKK